MRKKLTTEEFIEKAKEVHGDKYDYSKVEYNGNTIKVCVICPIHGEFWQTPKSHLKGCGCKICADLKNKERVRVNTDQFAERAKHIHGDKYIYSKVNYVSYRTKVCISCPKHGDFWQAPADHLFGQGCPECGRERKKHLLFGIGINDCKEAIYKEKAYSAWHGMIERCYSEKLHKKRSTYIGCTVSEDFKYLSKFKLWFDKNYVEGWHLDKDILIKGNKVYSPQTCCFVPPIINTVLTKTDSKRGKLPIGVKYVGKRGYKKPYTAQIEVNNKKIGLGYFYTIEEAFAAYKQAKEKWIKELANKWQRELNPNVYEALMNYKVEITD